MNFPFGYSVLTVALATMAIFLTSAGIMYTRTQGSRSVTRHVIDVNTAVREHSIVNVAETNRQSEISKFAKKHQHELKAATKDRKRECGSIISVSAIDCDICVLIVKGLSDLVAKGSTQEDIVKFSTEACIELEIEDARVCPAVVQQFKVCFLNTCFILVYLPRNFNK
jgi:hypothetical protein